MSDQPDNLPATAQAAQTPAKPEKKPRISKRLSDAINLLVTGQCRYQKDAAERVGMYPHSLSRELAKPHVRVFYEQRARQNIGSAVMRASARMVELMDADSEHVSAEMTKHIAAIAGIKPASDTQVSVNVDIKAGFVIDLTPPRDGSNAKQIDQVGT